MDCELCSPTVDLVAFVRDHGVLDYESATVDAIVTALGRERLLVVRHAGAPLLVGCLLHDLGNPEGASEILLLARRSTAERSAALAAFLGLAERLVREGHGARVEFQVPARLVGIEPELAALGYERVFDNLDLELEIGGPPRRLRHPLPAGAAWQAIDEPTLAAAYDCYEAAYRTVQGMQIVEREDFVRVMPTLAPPMRILVLEGRVLAFTRVGWKDEAHTTGEVFTLGRTPAATTAGLGAHTLAEGLRVLAELGARRVVLTVASSNLRALGLYTSFGFRTALRRAVLQKALAPPG